MYTERFGRTFRLPLSFEGQLDLLTNDQAGKLMRCIFKYQRTGKYPKDEQILDVAMAGLTPQFDRDNEHYEMICERNKINGAKGGRPPKS